MFEGMLIHAIGITYKVIIRSMYNKVLLISTDVFCQLYIVYDNEQTGTACGTCITRDQLNAFINILIFLFD